MKNKLKLLVAGNASEEYLENLKKLDIGFYKTRNSNFLYDSISYHPDIIVHSLDSKKIIVEKSSYDYYKEEFSDLDINIISTEYAFNSTYPNYTGLNIGKVGRYYIHNEKYTDLNLKNELIDRGYELINVKQGYSGCSVLTINDSAIITSDPGIAKTLKSNTNLGVLYIDPKKIRLDGMNNGFIGGCGVMISDNELLLTGKYDKLKDAKDIDEFLNNYKINVIYLSEKGINDIGGLIKLGCD